jgi:hypothetical protein
MQVDYARMEALSMDLVVPDDFATGSLQALLRLKALLRLS